MAQGDLEIDKILKDMMLLNKNDVKSGESIQIWDQFQYKFSMTGDLFNVEFLFKKNIIRVFQEHVDDGFDRCELRHAPLLLID